jgi:hypothetical protein
MTEQLTTELTGDQRLEVRRTLLQSIAEMGRGLKIMGLLLKQGQFAKSRDQIDAAGAMLTVHEGLAQMLLAENRRLDKVLALHAPEMLTTWDGEKPHCSFCATDCGPLLWPCPTVEALTGASA